MVDATRAFRDKLGPMSGALYDERCSKRSNRRRRTHATKTSRSRSSLGPTPRPSHARAHTLRTRVSELVERWAAAVWSRRVIADERNLGDT